MTPERQKLAVLMALWRRESPAHLNACLESLAAQTVTADEILIVKDGPLGEELESVLRAWERKLPIRTLQLKENVGTGAAMRLGLEQCRHELIARMDSDDVCVPRRFEIQLRFMEAHGEIDVLGGAIREFEQTPEDGKLVRSVPRDHASIAAFARRRNPVNQMTVMLRRSAVMAAGNYRTWIGFEDYDLWVRMVCHGKRFHNLEEVLVLARCGSGMQQRRGGWAYLKREAGLMWEFRRMGFLTKGEAVRNIAWRVPARLVPAWWRRPIYSLFLRRRASGASDLDPEKTDRPGTGTKARENG